MVRIGVEGTIWSTGTHNMWLQNPETGKMEPTKVNVTPQSLKQDYKILKENLPIPFGVDHLDMDPTFLKKNTILQKMNLLNVGVLKDVKLENNKIKITDAEITNPIIRELHENGELNDFSQVSNMHVRPCPTGMADKVEEYSVINRVDFVGTGACKTCKVDMPLAASSTAYNAKAIIGDESMAVDPNAGSNPDASGDGEAPEPTMTEVMAVIKDMATNVSTSLKAIEGALKIKVAPPAGEDPNAQTPPAAASEGDEEDVEGNASKPDPEVIKLREEMDGIKAQAAKADATNVVNGFLKEGKIKPAESEKHIAMAMKAPEEYQEVMKEAPVIIDMERHSTNPGAASDSEEDEDEYTDEKFEKDFEAAYGSKPTKE